MQAENHSPFYQLASFSEVVAALNYWSLSMGYWLACLMLSYLLLESMKFLTAIQSITLSTMIVKSNYSSSAGFVNLDYSLVVIPHY